eukprot:TRINITY_DN17177_c0_g1_i1.p2 TRINITY_DN17177_c0_g1~~TRINITY_DN17177_c0_g1_i1.p2  ORF type:complete len:136 (-),score=4.92 TRINITY_DN17177_c0_g1_i1:50-412(-)
MGRQNQVKRLTEEYNSARGQGDVMEKTDVMELNMAITRGKGEGTIHLIKWDKQVQEIASISINTDVQFATEAGNQCQIISRMQKILPGQWMTDVMLTLYLKHWLHKERPGPRMDDALKTK